MLHLMHMSYEPTNVLFPQQGFKTISAWLDDKIAGDSTLEETERKDPATVNLLHNMLIDEDPPMTAEREAVLLFCEIVERAAKTETGDRELADAALEVSRGMKDLADAYDPVHLALV